MKRALVLSGGGSRGAYECGAWQALREMNIRIDSVYGTSIGAINAALVAQGDLDVAVKLWNSITLNQIVEMDEEEELNIDRMLSGMRDLIPFLLENAKNFRLDITPLVNLLHETIDEKKIRAAGMDFGVMLTRFPQLSGREVRLSEIPQGRLEDYLIASASCFPVFPIKNIDGERYIDGDLLRRSRLMGYYDAMKAYGRFDGIRYTFQRVSDLKLSELARRYLLKIARFDARMDGRGDDAVLIGAIGAETPDRRLTWKESLLRGVELCAQAFGFREDAVYEFDALTKRMLDYARGQAELTEVPSDRSIAEAAKGGSRSLTVHLYAAMRWDGDFINRCAKKLSDYPMETAAAMLLNTLEDI